MDKMMIGRRAFLKNTAVGAGSMAVASSILFGQQEAIAQSTSSSEPSNLSKPYIQAEGENIDGAISADGKGVWTVKESIALRSLTISEGASLAAPEGKSLTMTVEGIGKAMTPGVYRGDIFLTVADKLTMLPTGLMAKGEPKEFRTGIFVNDGKYVSGKSIPAIVGGGKVTDKAATGVRIMSCEESFNGIIIAGNSEYTIEGATIYFEGMSHNDFTGEGAGIYCGDNTKVTVNNSSVRLNSVTRCALQVCGNSVATFNNCRISNESPDTDYMFPTWTCGLRGTNRVTQHCDSATSYYNNCHLSGNGWGVLSHDGGVLVRMYLKDSTIELEGPRSRGYGAYSIGDDCLVSIDHCTMNVQGYPLAMSGFKSKSAGVIKGGSVINSTLYGVLIFNVLSADLKVNRATFNTASSVFVVKGASRSNIDIDDAVMIPDNGVILQLMDNDLPDEMNYAEFVVPVGKVDAAVPGRDLTSANPEEDLFVTVSNTEVTGDFYNSTTNLKANCNKNAKKIVFGHVPGFPKEVIDGLSAMVDEIAHAPASKSERSWEDMQGPRNLKINFVNTRVNGVVSAATAAYKEGVTVIDYTNCQELSAVTQTAHEPVNNGVIVSFDKDSVWTVAGTSYLTSLTIDKGAVIKANGGKTLIMTVDGVKTKIASGTYKGKIVIAVV